MGDFEQMLNDLCKMSKAQLVQMVKNTDEVEIALNIFKNVMKEDYVRVLRCKDCKYGDYDSEGVPYWVSTHLARHVHAQPFIRSQRNDRQDEYDRNAARQDAPVDMIWYMSAEELMTIAEKWICKLAAKETREAVLMMRWLVVNHCPEFEGLLEPHCTKYGDCDEMKPCETGRRLQGGNDTGN